MPSKSDKARRMELRRELGNRSVKPRTLPVRGTGYLVAHACFDCRKSFKIAPRDERAMCPACGREIHWMGRSFKAPRRNDVPQWKKVQLLYAHGFRFIGTGTRPPLPNRLQDVGAFLRKHPNHPLKVADPIEALKPI